MIYVDVDLSLWVNKYKLDIETYTCPQCGDEFQTTRPIMTPDSAGLVTPIHGCGSRFWVAVLTPRKTESIAFWNTIV